MEWPDVDVLESFDEMEERLGIKREVDDTRPTQLGAHPSESYYKNKEPKIDIVRMRRKFDAVAKRYQG